MKAKEYRCMMAPPDDDREIYRREFKGLSFAAYSHESNGGITLFCEDTDEDGSLVIRGWQRLDEDGEFLPQCEGFPFYREEDWELDDDEWNEYVAFCEGLPWGDEFRELLMKR